MYDDLVFDDRFRYQLAMLEVFMTGRSRLLHTHIAYEIVIQTITTGIWHGEGNDLSRRTVVKR